MTEQHRWIDDLPQIDELDGWINMEKARRISRYSTPRLYQLIRQSEVMAMRWDRRTLLIEKASLLVYLSSRKVRAHGQ